VKVWINSDGSVRRVEYIGGHPLLAQAAIIAVKNWRYELGAKETTSQVEVKF
jgi:outer membrane biosynthesis protein TonB